LLALGSLACSFLPAQAQYADWSTNPPKILPNERPGSAVVFFTGSGRQFPNEAAFAALKSDGSVVTWGNGGYGGNSTSVSGNLSSNVTAVYSNQLAFAALKSDGSVVTWGDAPSGGNSASVSGNLSSNVTAVYSNGYAFAALKSDGSVVTWGDATYGGNSASVSGNLSSNVTAVYSNGYAFAALKTDGSVVTWGDASTGGNSTSVSGNLTSNVTAVYSTRLAFAALKSDGSVVTWGDATFGGNSTSVSGNLSSNVTAVYSNVYAFAALKSDGSVVTWGNPSSGGNSTSVSGNLSSNVKAVYSNPQAFAALKNDGSVVTWGKPTSGGNSASVSGNLSSNVTAVYSNAYAFAALKSDGSVVTWGLDTFGGNSTSVSGNLSSNVKAVYSTQLAFAALKTNGSVVTWGDASSGGYSTAVSGNLSTNVTAVYAIKNAFAALKADGSIVTWGSAGSGGAGGPTGTGFTSVQSVHYYQPGPSISASTDNITSTTTTLRGEVTSQGNSPVIARGFVYALASVSEPKIGDAGVTQVAVSGSGLGSYSQLLSGLTPNTAYVFRAYVVNGEGTTYSAPANLSTNLPPVITSGGGNATLATSVAENSLAVSTVSATDADAGQTITYSISGGADAARFAIGSTSGVLTFVAAPDFEAPADADANNVYTVIVQATDNGNTPKSATQTLTITVTNVLDNGVLAVEQPAGSALASGNGSVGFGNRTIGQPAELTFTLRSQGEAALLLPSGAVISGAAASDFSLVGSVAASLPTGGNTTFTVRFSPTASGNRSATLSIPTNDTRPGRSPYTITLTGNGSATPTIASYTTAASQVLGGWVNGGNFTIGGVAGSFSANTTKWLSSETPDKVVDANTGSKFLISRNSNAGVILKPTNSSLVFNRLALSTANDASERDPASFILYGSSSNLTGTEGTNIPVSSLTQIASGNVTMLDARNAGPTVVQFANTVAYTSYVVVFPAVRNPATAVGMQISEIQLSQGANPPLAVAMADARGGQLSGSNFSFGSIGNSNPGTNWLAGESPDHAMDGNAGTKFAIFRSSGAGLLASPQAGPARMNTLTLWTANDAPERDPATYQVYGFPTRITQTSGTLAVGNGTLLANGTVTLPADRNSGPVQVDFDNGTAYSSYLVVFPTVKNSSSTNLTQISEVQFSYNGTITPSAGLIGNFTASAGSASASQSFTVNGRGLSGPVTLIAPTGFEISTDNSTFSSSLQVNNPGGTIQSVYRGAFGNYTTASDNIWSAGSGVEFPNQYAFAAITSNGSVVTWGFDTFGGNSTNVAGNLTSDVTAVYSNGGAFAALKTDGSVVTWGDAAFGGNSTNVAGKLSSNVTAVYSTIAAFAALKTDGSVVTWGNAGSGGNSTSVAGNLTSNVTAVYSTQAAFAALKANGSVVTWGDAAFGGNSTSVAGNLSSNVTAVYSNPQAFAALKTNGSVVTWGNALYGGNSTNVSGGNLSSNVTAVYSNSYAFAALKANGSVVTWGFADWGGNSTKVTGGNLTSNVTAVYSTPAAFAALKANGSVVTWGDAAFGGNSTSVAGNLTSNVKAVHSTQLAFAALKTDGSVVTWGDAAFGGNSTSVAGNLTSNVKAVYSTRYAFAALKTDGSVVTWGSDSSGGNSTSVAGKLSSNVTAVYSTPAAFAALKTDGSVVTWGDVRFGASGDPANIGAGFPIPATIYTRLSSTAPAGSVSGNLTLTSSGVGNQTVALSGTVSSVSAPTIAASPASLGNFTTTFGSASASQSFTVNGTALTANITVTAPSGFQISSDNATFSSSLSLTRTGGNVTAANVYARIASSASVGPVSGNITLASPGAEPKSVTLSGIVGSAATPSISVTPVALTGFTASFGSASAAQSFTVNGSNLTANITVGAPAGFEVSSTVGGVFSANLSLAPVSGTVAPTSLYTRLAATAQAGANSGNLTLASTGATSRQVALSGTVTLPYEDWVAYWATQNGSFSGATALGTADSDSDGYNNTAEFAFGSNPLAPTASNITVAPAGGNITVTFLARVGNGTTWTGGNATGNGLNYQIQSTANLMLGFQSANVTVGLDSNQSGIPSADIPYQRWKFQAPISGQMKFYRVKAGNATTEPVGFLTMNITAGTGSAKRLSLISAPLLDTASINGSVAGRLTGVTSANLTCSSANWTAGALSQAATPYLIQMTSGNATGHMLLISTTVNNTASTVTINSDDVAAANGNIASLGIAVGDSFKIIPCDTLSSFLGTPATTAVLGNGTAANADTVILTTNGVSQGYYYSSNLTRWTRDAAGLADSSNVPIRPDAGIQYSRLRNIPLSLTVIGKAPTMARKAPVKNSGVTCLATFFPHNATLASLGLQNLSNWTTGPSAAVADTVTILSNGISSTYYHNGTNWVKNAFGNPISNSVVIPAGASLLINQRGSDPQTSIFSQPLPYSF